MLENLPNSNDAKNFKSSFKKSYSSYLKEKLLEKYDECENMLEEQIEVAEVKAFNVFQEATLNTEANAENEFKEV